LDEENGMRSDSLPLLRAGKALLILQENGAEGKKKYLFSSSFLIEENPAPSTKSKSREGGEGKEGIS